ncbi:hypothetical protein [Pseudoblastomonas halimionae]|nr:hypothetical protein [Alteriqipengyuania halimionae]
MKRLSWIALMAGTLLLAACGYSEAGACDEPHHGLTLPVLM